MAITPDRLDEAGHAFLTEPRLATLTSALPDGRFHVVPVAPVWDRDELRVRIVTRAGSVKVANADAGGEGVVGLIDGGRWMSLHGPLEVRRDPARVADTIDRYTALRQAPRGDFERVSLEIAVELVRGRWG